MLSKNEQTAIDFCKKLNTDLYDTLVRNIDVFKGESSRQHIAVAACASIGQLYIDNLKATKHIVDTDIFEEMNNHIIQEINNV